MGSLIARSGSRRTHSTRSGRLALEPLEPRVLLSASSEEAVELFNALPAVFVENQGQWADESVRFAHNGAGANVGLTDLGAVFQVFRDDPATDQTQMLQFSASFVGANAVAPVGTQQAETLFNYHVGDDPSRWLEGVPSYEVVAYEGLYEGIDLRTWGVRSHLKYEFHVAPGADWSQIQVRYEGIAGLSLAEDGSLVVDLGGDWGCVVDDAPYIYQESEGARVEVPGHFVLLDAETYAFEVTGPYDPTRPLVIDPELGWSTYLGGGNGDSCLGIAHNGGAAYVTGFTQSSGWVSGGYDTVYGGSTDAFVAKLSPSGTHLWSTYLGGSGEDRGYGIAAGLGFVYVTGYTESSGWTSGGFDTIYNGGGDAFVALLSFTGVHSWSSYLGESGEDCGYGITFDPDSPSNCYVTGSTASSGWTFNGHDTTYNGGPSDAFVAQVTKLAEFPFPFIGWSTYLGGIDKDCGYGIAYWRGDGSTTAAVYVTGSTWSSGWANGGYDGSGDGFLVNLTPGGGHAWSAYVGFRDGGEDCGYGIAVDTTGGVYVTGSCPGYQDGDTDIYVEKWTAQATHEFTLRLGGKNFEDPLGREEALIDASSDGFDVGYGIAVDDTGMIYVTGRTTSKGWAIGGPDTDYGEQSDAFVVKLTARGSRIWSTYLGGSGLDSGRGIALDGMGGVYVAGGTGSPGWVSGGFDTTYNGGQSDAFVAKIEDGHGYQFIALGAGLPVPLTRTTFTAANGELVSVRVGKTGLYLLTRETPTFDENPSNSDPGDLLSIEALETDASSSIRISVKSTAGMPFTSVGGIVVDGPLRSLTAPRLNVTGPVLLKGGVGKLALGDVTNVDSIGIGCYDPLMRPANLTFGRLQNVQIGSLMPIRSLRVGEWLDPDWALGGQSQDRDYILAPWISSLTTKRSKVAGGPTGDFQADVMLSDYLQMPLGTNNWTLLGRARIAGSVVGGYWEIDLFAGSISVAGNFWNCSLFAGELSSLRVRGTIWQDNSDGDTDWIRVFAGSFLVSDQTWSGTVPPEHWFGSVHAYVQQVL